MNSNVLKSKLAGTWYTDNPEQLAREIDAYLGAVHAKPIDDVIALLLPHAGYRYSGMVAAHGIRQIAGKTFSRVVVIGPSHRAALLDSVSIPDVSHIETPLGLIEVDRELVSSLLECHGFSSHPFAHQNEHSVQIELPLLQRALGDFKVVPIVCGDLSRESVHYAADTLRRHIDEETLVVISSDFTHYGRSFSYVPFTENIKENIESLDMGAFRQFEEKNLDGFLQYINNTDATICGRNPMAILLAMLPDDAEVELLRYDTSGNLTGDWSHCVSYVAAAISGHWSKPETHQLEPKPTVLSELDKKNLLRLARHRITRKLKRNEPELEMVLTPPMHQVMGAFVTLHKHGMLRGCIGEIFPCRELYKAIEEQAVNAAFNDPRFPHLREDELSEVKIEISALTEPQAVKSYSDIVIGRHGIVLSKGIHSAVFLPQVATEQGWGLEETLTYLAKKAGLNANDWKSGCEFHVFEAIVFHEL